jgi:aminopeptidase YwaD
MKNSYFVLGAHFDHLGWGFDGSLYRGTTPMIHNGADDNASGTAGMLELAQYFSAHPLRHSILFMGFTGEEMGLLGSSEWVKNPTRPLKDAVAMFNLDMIGRLPDSTRKLNVQGTGTSPVWEQIVRSANAAYKFDLGLVADGQGASDQSTFYMKNIPVLFFFTGLHTDYHRPSDDFETLNMAGEEQVVRYIADIVSKTDAEKGPIAYVRVKKTEDQRVRGFNVYVGTIPDYGSTEDGFKITGTSPGSPAEKAGLKAGDLIIQFGDTKIKNIYDYMNALGLHKPEEDVQAKVRRGGETVELTIHLIKK